MNILKEKSFQLASEILKITDQMKLKRQFHIANQLIRSGTSIGANIQEAFAGQSKKDFIFKLNIAYKEMRETEYWLKLIHLNYKNLPPNFHQTDTILTEVAKILTATLKTAKANYKLEIRSNK